MQSAFQGFRRVSYAVVVTMALFASPVQASSASGRIVGRVLDAETEQPIPGVTLMISEAYAGTKTDSEGFFDLRNLSVGTYSLQVSHVGYESKEIDSVAVTADHPSELTISLLPRVVRLKGITVTPGRFSIMGTEPTSQQTLTRREIQSIPQLGDDFFRAVSRLPGMGANDFSTKFTVRGGEYEEVLVTLDGLQLYEPFHLKDIDGGAMSVIDGAAVESIDLLTGGFAADYGNKMSGVFNIKSRNVPPDRNRINVGVSFINARALAEGMFDNNRGSWLVSARRGYIDYVLKLADPENTISPTYYDAFGKIRYQLGRNYVLTGNLLHAHDNLEFKGDDYDIGDTLITEYGNTYVWLTLWAQPHSRLSGRTMVAAGRVDHDRRGQLYDWNIQGVEAMARDIKDFSLTSLKTDWEYESSDRLFLKFGGEIRDLSADYDYLSRDYFYSYQTDSTGTHSRLDYVDSISLQFDKSGSQIGVYLSGRSRLAAPLVAEVGARYDYASYTDDELVSPRANLVYELDDRTTLRLGWGLYYQIQEMNSISAGDGEPGFYPAQKAEQRVIGYEHEFEGGIRLRLEGYYKKYSDLRRALRNSFDPIEPFPEREIDREIVHRRSSTARGLEVYLKKDSGGRLSWWLSYALAKVEEVVDSIYFSHDRVSAYFNDTIPTPHDQRHTAYLDVHYRPSPKWQISGAFQYHSGWPYTDVYLASSSTPEGTRYWVQAGEHWASRHKDFHRLDIRVSRHFPLSHGRITAFVEMLNVLGRGNVRGYNQYLVTTRSGYRIEQEEKHWFGRIPSFGITYDVEL